MRVYRQAHFQTRLYEMAKRTEGVEIARIVIVVIDDAGGFELIECGVSTLGALALIHVYREAKGLPNG